MPATVNGIGTHYYGKKNVKTRSGYCEHCAKQSTLTSYDTGEYIVVLFIPIFPLGKKHIIDLCDRCSRHRVMDLKAWERTRSQTLEKALTEFQADPGNGQKAVQLHATYRYFGQRDEAEQLLAFIQEKLEHDADVLFYLGQLRNEENRAGEALQYFERALALKPNDPTVRLAAGLQRLDHGDLLQAHELLRSYEQDQPQRNPGVLVALANAYQCAGNHQESVRLLQLAGGQSPDLMKNKKVRKMLHTSQRALGQEILTPTASRFSLWPMILGACAVLAVVGGLYLVNDYFANNRTLHIVNGSGKPVTVTIDGQQWVVNDSGPLTVRLPEGKHHAVYSGGITGQADFTIESGLMERYSSSTVYVLNPNGEAVLGYATTEYAERSLTPNAKAGSYTIRHGQDLERFDDIDYVFRPFPPEIRLDQHQQRVIKSRVEVVDADPTDVFNWLAEEKGEPAALKFAEDRLADHPDNFELLSAYMDAPSNEKHTQRTLAFLEKGCAARPVRFGWHQLYQDQLVNEGHFDDAVKQYQTLLEESPYDPDRLCLRARLELNRTAWMDLIQRALKSNPNHLIALGFMVNRMASQGDWKETRTWALKAIEKGAATNVVEQCLTAARMALHEYDELDAYLRKRRAEQPAHYALAEAQQFLYVERQDSTAIQKLRKSYRKALKDSDCDNETVNGYTDCLQASQLYAEGRFEELLKNHGSKANDDGGWRYEALIGLDRLDEAEKLLEEDKSLVDWSNLLTLSIALRAKGEAERAEALFEEAHELLLDGGPWDVAIGGALTTDNTPAPERLDRLVVYFRQKALIALAMAQREPEHAPELIELSRKLNATRQFPYHLIKKLTEQQK